MRRCLFVFLILGAARTALAQDIAVSVNPSGFTADSQNWNVIVSVANLGPSAASNIVISDTFSGPVTFVSASLPAGSCTDMGPVTCTIPSLGSGSVEGITIVLKSTAIGDAFDTASLVTSTPADTNSANNSGSAFTHVVAGWDRYVANLACTPAPPTISPGQTLQCSVSAGNNGPDPTSAGADIQFPFNPGVTVIGIPTSSNPAFICSGATTECGCFASSAAAGVTTSISFTLRAPITTGTFSIQASTGGRDPEHDTNGANETQSLTYTVGSPTAADVGVAISGSGPMIAGQSATFTTTVTNHGSTDAQGVSVASATPSGLTFLSNSGACTTAFPCSLGTLAAGASATITSRYSIPASASGAGSITAQVSTTSSDSDSSNNSSSLQYSVSTSADLSITTAPVGSLTPGHSARYVTTVMNNGPSDARDVSVSRQSDAGKLIFVSNSGACMTAFPCSLGTLAAGSSAVITSMYSVAGSATGMIDTTTQASSSTSDPNSSNNSAMTSSAVSTTVAAPAAAFSWIPTQPVAGANVQFVDQSTGSPSDWMWDFGDGSQSTTRDAIHAFATPGTFNVTLTASNSAGSSRKVLSIVIGGSPSGLSASFYWSPSQAVMGQTLSFIDQSTGAPTSWFWTFGNGASSHDRNPHMTYTNPGAYVVTLTAANAAAESSISHIVPVSPQVAGACPPLTGQNVNIAHAGLTSACNRDVDVCATNESIEFAAVHPDCGVPSFTWSFGDGSQPSTFPSPTHQYANAGTYVVTLIFANGASSVVVTQPIQVGTPESTPARRRSIHH